MTAPLIGAANCGGCFFADTVKDDFNLIECNGVPPTPVMMGMGPQGPAMMLVRPRIPRAQRACALHRAKTKDNTPIAGAAALVR